MGQAAPVRLGSSSGNRACLRVSPLLLASFLSACGGGNGSANGMPEASTSDQVAQDTGVLADGSSDGDSGHQGDSGSKHDSGNDAGSLAVHAGMATVSGGVAATSKSYQMVTTTGQSPGSNATLSSSSYRMTGGVVGATQGN